MPLPNGRDPKIKAKFQEKKGVVISWIPKVKVKWPGGWIPRSNPEFEKCVKTPISCTTKETESDPLS